MILFKAYLDANGETVRVQDGSFQDLDSIAAGLTRIPGADVTVSADLLTNLDLDAKLDDSQLIDDDTFASASATTVPSSESVKAYVDAQIASNDEASEISYDPSTSGLTATNVQDAIDEVEGRLDTAETNIATNSSDIATNSGNISTNTTNIATNTGNIATNAADIDELELNQDDLITLTGVAENSTDLGVFTGTTVADNVSIKIALQQLETGLENVSSTIRVTDVSVVADIPARDALVGVDEGDVAKVLDADGNGNPETFIFDGTNWVSLKSDDLVDSVNGQIGNVVLTTTEIAEGTNLYFTNTRARTAAVVNSMAGTETDQAPSVDSVKTFIQNELDGQDEASEISYDNATSGLTATNVQDAIDENDGRLDALEGQTYVNSFNGRTGAVVPVASDYDADQVDYDDTTTSLGATDVQGAIEALAALRKEYFYANQTVAQTGINGSPVNVVFDNEAKNSDVAVFSLNTTTGEVTVNKAGDYKVEYIVTADTQDGARRTSETTLEIDTGSGYAPISASLGSATAYGYHRNNASGENSAAAHAILTLAVGDSLRLRLRRSNGGGQIQTVPVGTSIILEEK